MSRFGVGFRVYRWEVIVVRVVVVSKGKTDDRQEPARTRAIGQWLVSVTESVLTMRRRRKLRARAKARKRGPIRDWLAAFGSAIIWVLIINQYTVQAYEIPSPSMEPTLLVKDRLFVDKLTFGPELVPGAGKLPGFRAPSRGEIVVFENPLYLSRGPLFETVNRVVYFTTQALVNLDRDEAGEDRAQLLIKRVVGVPGDIVTFDRLTGEFEIQPKGTASVVSSAELVGDGYQIQRLVSPHRGHAIRAAAIFHAVSRSHPTQQVVPPPSEPITRREAGGQVFDYWYRRERVKLNPSTEIAMREYQKMELGIYVPEGRFLPLGDNRDNSNDGRYFGPVETKALLGRAMVRFWPLPRFGAIR